MSAQGKFEALAEETSERATKVPCSKEAYVDGLELIIAHLQGDLAAAEETSERATKVPCSKEAYVDGLELIIAHLQGDLAAAKETL